MSKIVKAEVENISFAQGGFPSRTNVNRFAWRMWSGKYERVNGLIGVF